MAENDGQEKTEQASEKKLREGREKGQVAKSMEINSLAIFTSGLLLVYFSQNLLGSKLGELSRKIFSNLDTLELNSNIIQSYILDGALFFMLLMAPVFAGLFVVAFVVSVAQVGFKVSGKAIAPNFKKFNVFAGVKRMLFSSRSLMETSKSLIKLIVIASFTYFVLSQYVLDANKLVELTITDIITFIVDSSYTLLWKIALVFGVIATTDFAYQKFKHKKDMMMSKQEVKEENKQSEGDPLIKSRIRKMQYASSRNRMMQQVPTADVIITNPTHYAVAIKYEFNKDSAPKVVAKGVDELAMRIKELGKKNNITIHEDRVLARALYKLCDVGDSIPQELFKTVAQILAYIYQMKKKKKKHIV